MSYCSRMPSASRRIVAAACLAVVFVIMPISAAPVTVTGELVDVQCLLEDAKNAGPDHVDCALSCAKRGAVLGILAADGLYVVTGTLTLETNRRLIEFVATTATATGTVTERGGRKLLAATDIRRADQ